MNQWTRESFFHNSIWYHATSLYGLQSILKNGIDAKFNKNNSLDYGYGLYLTPNKQWAKEYAKRIVRPTISEKIEELAVIIEFNFRPCDLDINITDIPFYHMLNDDFCDFVFVNRVYAKRHIFTKTVHHYPIVAGVMSDGNQDNDFNEFLNRVIDKHELYRRLKEPREDWQLVLHSQKICDTIEPSKAYNLKGVEFDVSSYKSKKSNRNVFRLFG